MSPEASFQVVVAGGGVAGLETVMALRALAGGRVHSTLVTPERDFVYRPLSVAEPFDAGEARRYPLEGIAHEFGVELVRDQLERVEPDSHRVFTSSGEELEYDALVLATGARPQPVWDHALTFSGPRDVEAIRTLIAEVARGEVTSLAFVVPTGATWPLPLYELALMTAAHARRAEVSPELTIFTAETAPLAVFGEEASAEVAAQLAASNVSVLLGVEPDVSTDGRVGAEGTRFDRVVAIPRLAGTAPPGLPRDEQGFIPIDTHGVVHGVEHVYAAGDGTDFPVKQGGLAAQQADAVAEVIARRAGAAVEPRSFPGVLRSQLLTGGESRFLRTDLSLRASPRSEASEVPLWWPATKIAGLHLAPYLAAKEAADAPIRPEVQEEVVRVAFVPGDFENNPWGE